MDTLELLLLLAGLTGLVVALHWANDRLALGLDLRQWGLSFDGMDGGDFGCGGRSAAADEAREELARLRARIEELEAIVSEPEYETARQFARL